MYRRPVNQIFAGSLIVLLCGFSFQASEAAETKATGKTPKAASKNGAPPATALAQASQLYQARRYAEASSLFWQAVQKEGAGASGYLYLAHCQYALGNLKQAIPYYRYVRDTYRDSPESKVAAQYLAKLDSASATRSTPGSAAATEAAGGAVSGNLLDRIELVRPVMSHPELAKLTISTIRDDLKNLPKAVQKILIDGGIKFCITTTLVDKYPEMGYQEGRGYDGQTLKRCPGMFRGDTVIICERVIDEASNEVESQILPGQLTQTFYHEIGHALDSCLNDYSMKDDYRHAYYLDIARIPPDAAGRLAYYMQKSDAGQQESCGEITSVCLGSGGRNGDDIRTYFPLTMAFIKKKLNIDAMHIEPVDK